MSFTKTFYIGDVEFEVEFEASRFVSAKTSGPVENCHPAEGGEVEIESISIGGFEVSDVISETTRFQLEKMCNDAAPGCFEDEEAQNQEDAAEARACHYED